jgi:hypothetical protein
VVAVAAFASGRPSVGAVVVGAFGLARGLTAMAAVRGSDVVHALAAFARRSALTAANAIALVVVAVAAALSIRGPVRTPAIAAAAIAAVFAWGAAWKMVRFDVWRSIVGRYRLGALRGLAAVGVPLTEATVVALVVAGARRNASILALVLLAAFSVAAIRRRLADPSRVPCGCLGAGETTIPALLARNAALASAAALVLARAGAAPLRAPTASEALPVALSLAGALGVAAAARSVRRSLRGGRA